jgi:hypothetical protein
VAWGVELIHIHVNKWVMGIGCRCGDKARIRGGGGLVRRILLLLIQELGAALAL